MRLQKQDIASGLIKAVGMMLGLLEIGAAGVEHAMGRSAAETLISFWSRGPDCRGPGTVAATSRRHICRAQRLLWADGGPVSPIAS